MSLGRQAACLMLAGVALFVVGLVFHLVVPAVAPAIPPQYADTGLFRPWAGWTATYMAVHPFGYGILFAITYLSLLKRGGVVPGWAAGCRFGVGLFLVGALPVYLLEFASFRVSAAVITSWAVQAIFQYAAAGAAIGSISHRERVDLGRR